MDTYPLSNCPFCGSLLTPTLGAGGGASVPLEDLCFSLAIESERKLNAQLQSMAPEAREASTESFVGVCSQMQ
jgi:hypothetical protein